MSRRPALRGKRKFRQQFHRDILEVDDNSFLWKIPVALGCRQVSGYILNLHNESWKSAMCFFISPTIAVMSLKERNLHCVSANNAAVHAEQMLFQIETFQSIIVLFKDSPRDSLLCFNLSTVWFRFLLKTRFTFERKRNGKIAVCATVVSSR